MKKLTRREKTLFALPLLVPVGLWAIGSLEGPPTHLKPADLVGTYKAELPEGEQTLKLEKSGNVKTVLVLHSGYTYKQNTGSWKLVGQPNSHQRLDVDGFLWYDNETKQLAGVGGGIYPITESDGEITIYSAYGRYQKQ